MAAFAPTPALAAAKQASARLGIRTPGKAKPDKAAPAGAGSDVEARILESLGNPEHRSLTVRQRCQEIGVSHTTWYRHVGDPLFRARAVSVYRTMLDEQLGPVMETLSVSALIPGREGYQDRKLLLELVGMYDGGRKGGAVEEEGPKKPAQEMSDSELLAAFEGRENELPPGVLRRLGRDPDAAKAAERATDGRSSHKT